MKDKICYMLKELSIPPHLNGFDYLIEAIEMVYNDPSTLHAITKELYPNIAKSHGSTKSMVERNIRHAVEWCFDNSTPELLKDVFGNTVNMTSGKVTNGHFIATVVEILKYEPNHPIFDGSQFEGNGRRKVSVRHSGRFA